MYHGIVRINEQGDQRPAVGIVVTDGRNVVHTDEKGAFSLPGYEKTRFITLTTPAGYRTKQWYQPVCEQDALYEFCLEPFAPFAGPAHTFLQITDTEVGAAGAVQWSGFLRDYISAQQPAFLVQTGDICREAGLRTHIRDVNESTMGCPVYYCIGNHDYVQDDERGGESLYESLYGPVWYSFDCGNIHYVVLPMECYTEYPSAYTLQDSQQWLQNDLANKDPKKGLIVFSHAIQSSLREHLADAPGLPVLDLRDYGLRARAYGHYHFRCVRHQDGFLSISTSPPDKGGVDHSLMAFSRVDIDTDQAVHVTSRHFYVPRQAAVVYPPMEEDVVLRDSLPLELSCYYYGADTLRAEVTARQDGDTAYTVELSRAGQWHWRGELSGSVLRPGPLSLTARAVFQDGSTITEESCCILQTETKSSASSADKVWKLNWCRWMEGPGLFCAPVWADGRLLAATCDDDGGPSAIWALDPVDGQVIWKYPVRSGIKNVLGYGSGIVVAQDVLGNVYAVDVQSGRLRWEFQLPMDDTFLPYLSEGLLVYGDVVYAGYGEALCALRLEDGNLIWKSRERIRRIPSCQRWTMHDGVLVSGIQWACLFGCDSLTGEILWEHHDNHLRFRSTAGASDPYQEDGTFYIPSTDTLHRIHARTGEILNTWTYPAFNFEVAAAPLITEKHILLASANKGVLAVEKATGQECWRFTPQTALVCSSPYTRQPAATVEAGIVRHGELCTFGSSDGYIYTLELTTGRLVEKHRTGAPILAVPTLTPTGLAVMDLAGGLYCFSSLKVPVKYAFLREH